MKKAVAIILACCMIMLTLSFAANAETGNTVGSRNAELEAAIAAVVDKLDPSVIECLYNPTGDGRFFEIHYHSDKYPNKNQVYYAEEELLAQIGNISYYECPNGVRGKAVNKLRVGLPYTSVVSVAALDNVDYITLPDFSQKFLPGYDPQNKIDADLKEMTAQMNPDDSIMVRGVFAYEELRIYVGIDIDKCKTEEELQHYYEVLEANKRACYTAMNEEYKNKLVQNAARDGIVLGNLTYFETTKVFTVETTVSAIDVLAGYDEVFRLQVYEEPYEPPTGATEIPSECPTQAPTARPTTAPTTPPTIAPTAPPTTPPTEAPTEPKDLYRERLKEYYNLSEFDGDFYTYQLMGYQELYYHRDGKGDIDWALIQCYCNIESPIELIAIVGNRVLHQGTAYYPFDTTFGIYDVKNDKFIDACTSGAYLSEAYNYDGFVRAFDEIVGGGMGWSMADHDNAGKGRPLGDIDNDFDLSIVDVTMIQRCEAMITEYPASDAFAVSYDYRTTRYYSDFNLDGERDIVDATCIQRYLVGMDYPIG